MSSGRCGEGAGQRPWGGECGATRCGCGAASLGRGGHVTLEAVAGGGVPVVGVAGGGVEVRDDLLFPFFFIFFWVDKVGLCPCQHM
jgi:hypothetical protein